MTSIRRLAIGTTLAAAILNSAPIRADEGGELCDQTLRACDEALTSCMVLVEAHEQENSALRRLLAHKNEKIEGLNVWYRQPQYVIPASLLIGVVGGLYLGRR